METLGINLVNRLSLTLRTSILGLLKHGAKRLAEHNLVCVIEPLSIRKAYYLRCYSQAKSILEQLDQPNLKILIDSYHMQMLNGNLTTIVSELREQTGHVQISQAPLRDCPANTGEINFDYFLGLIAKSGYRDYVGLEYNGELAASMVAIFLLLFCLLFCLLSWNGLFSFLFSPATSDEQFNWLDRFESY